MYRVEIRPQQILYTPKEAQPPLCHPTFCALPSLLAEAHLRDALVPALDHLAENGSRRFRRKITLRKSSLRRSAAKSTFGSRRYPMLRSGIVQRACDFGSRNSWTLDSEKRSRTRSAGSHDGLTDADLRLEGLATVNAGVELLASVLPGGGLKRSEDGSGPRTIRTGRPQESSILNGSASCTI